MAQFLKGNENAYNVISDCIVSPLNLHADTIVDASTSDVDVMLPIKRSYRATKILEQDISMAARIQKSGGTLEDIEESDTLILDGTRAGLLAKKLFHAYACSQESSGGDGGGACATTSASSGSNKEDDASKRQTLPPHIPHVNHLLQSLLEGYASAVVSAACAGGKAGIESNFGPMLTYRSAPTSQPQSQSSASASATNAMHADPTTGASHDDANAGSTASLESPLPVLAAIVTTGCTGRLAPGAAAEQRAANPMMMQQQQQNDNAAVHISKGHRRKFVRSLADWDLLTRLADCIDHPGTDESDLYRSEAACDALLNIVDTVGFPPMPPPGVAVDAKKRRRWRNRSGRNCSLLHWRGMTSSIT